MTNQNAVITDDQRRVQLEQAREAGTLEAQILTLDVIREVGTLDGGALQRWVVRVPLYPKHQYLIKGASRNRAAYGSKGKDWVSEYSAGIRAEGYDKLNKVAGIRFFTPETVHDRDGKEVPNPIHARDYLYHREIGQGYSETGQMVLYVEDIEIDYRQAWEQERLKKLQQLLKSKKTSSGGGGGSDVPPWEEMDEAPPSAPKIVDSNEPMDKYLLRDENGMPKMAENGGLLFRLPEAMEADAMQRISQLRNYGGRQARTICRRRILQQALALRTLWTVETGERPEITTQWVWVTGWRDMLTTDEALEKARTEAKQVFGAPIGTYVTEAVHDDELDETAPTATIVEEFIEAVEVNPETGEVIETSFVKEPPTPAMAVNRVDPGTIPGVTKGMPGEKLSKAVCGERDVVGPNPCTKEPGHCPMPHRSEDGVWPCES